MKKLFTTCALILLGTLSAIAAGGGKQIIKATKVRKASYKSLYILTTENDEEIKTFAWGKERERIIKNIIEKEQTAIFTLAKAKNGRDNRVVRIEVANSSNRSKKTFTASKIKKLKYGYEFTTKSGKKINAFAWGKYERRVKRIMKNGQTAKFTLGKAKNGQNKINKIEVVD